MTASRAGGDRVQRYGKAIWEASHADEGTISYIGANHVARAVMAVADAEQSEWKALAFLNEDNVIPGGRQRAAEARAGEYKRELVELQDVAARLRAKLARVEALCDRAEMPLRHPRLWAGDIRAALAGE